MEIKKRKEAGKVHICSLIHSLLFSPLLSPFSHFSLTPSFLHLSLFSHLSLFLFSHLSLSLFHLSLFSPISLSLSLSSSSSLSSSHSPQDWLDLDPQRVEEYKAQQEELRIKREAELAAANAPISAKIESTGGPYTLKQLTCAKEFLPDDVDPTKKEIYLSDADFLTVFKMDKAKFEALPKWKQTNEKNQRKLN